MLKSIEIKNFQAHENLTVDLDECCTTILGPSDVGKSSIIRALQWVALNLPAGESMIRWGRRKKGASVKVQLSGSQPCEVARRRSSTDNAYIVAVGGREAASRAFGAAVPDDVISVLGLSPINFQAQHDPIFWLSASSGEVARQLNKVVNLDLIDKVHSGIASRKRRVDSDLASAQTNLDRASNELEKLDFVPSMEMAFDGLHRLESGVAKAVDEIGNLAEASEQIESAAKAISEDECVLDSLRSLIVMGADVGAWEEEIEILSKRISRIEAAEEWASLAPPNLSELEDLTAREVSLAGIIRDLTDLGVSIAKLSETIIDDRKALKVLKKQFDEEIGETCPLCQQPIRN